MQKSGGKPSSSKEHVASLASVFELNKLGQALKFRDDVKLYAPDCWRKGSDIFYLAAVILVSNFVPNV